MQVKSVLNDYYAVPQARGDHLVEVAMCTHCNCGTIPACSAVMGVMGVSGGIGLGVGG